MTCPASSGVYRSTTCSASVWKLPAMSNQVRSLKCDVGDEGVFLPVTARIAHPEVVRRRMFAAVGVDDAGRVLVFKVHRHVLRRLRDLERERHVQHPRNPGQEALLDRIE